MCTLAAVHFKGGPVAQWTERLRPKEGVRGSTPLGASTRAW